MHVALHTIRASTTKPLFIAKYYIIPTDGSPGKLFSGKCEMMFTVCNSSRKYTHSFDIFNGQCICGNQLNDPHLNIQFHLVLKHPNFTDELLLDKSLRALGIRPLLMNKATTVLKFSLLGFNGCLNSPCK